jgi:hypothetical protein
MDSSLSDPQLDAAIRTAWAATRGLVLLTDDMHQPSDAYAFLTNGVRELADQRSASATAECAKRFEIVSGWICSSDRAAAAELADVAARLRSCAAPG